MELKIYSYGYVTMAEDLYVPALFGTIHVDDGPTPTIDLQMLISGASNCFLDEGEATQEASSIFEKLRKGVVSLTIS